MRSQNIRWGYGLALATIAAAAVFMLATSVNAESGGPTVTLESTSATTTNDTSIAVDVTFSESVTGFEDSDISVTNGTVTNFSGSGATYSFDLEATADGEVTAKVPADVADSATTTPLGNEESNTLSFTFDATAPVINDLGTLGATTTSATPTFEFTSDEEGSINLSGGCTSSTTMAVVGTTTLMFDTLAEGNHSCMLSVTDEAGNTSNELDIDFAVQLADAPVISDLQVSGVGQTTATISWDTDIAADSELMYGTTTAYGSVSTSATSTTSHSVTLTGLQEATTYHFMIQSTSAGGTASSSDQTFVTLSSSSSTPLAVDSIDTVDSSAVADNLFEDGWKWIIHFTVPDDEDAFRIRFSDWGNASSSFSAEGNMRLSIAQSSNASTTSSGWISTGTGYSDWFYLDDDTSTSTPGRQVALTVEVKIPFGTNPGAYSSSFTAQTYPMAATSTAMTP